MFQSREQREARRQIDEKVANLQAQLEQLQRQHNERKQAYDAEIEQLAQSSSDKWEYLEFVEQKSAEEMLNMLGAYGWELVSVTFFDIIEDNWRMITFKYIFKRKKVSVPPTISSKYNDIPDLERKIASISSEIENLKRQRKHI